MKGEINKVCMNDIITLDIANQLIQQKKNLKEIESQLQLFGLNSLTEEVNDKNIHYVKKLISLNEGDNYVLLLIYFTEDKFRAYVKTSIEKSVVSGFKNSSGVWK